jgi:uncharacterized protein YdhG (YjbR/CyaY superfamily)
MAISKHKFSNVDQYIALQPEAVQEGLQKLRQTIRKAAPQAEELISYGMPGYRFHGMLVYFAAWKNHIGFYVMPDGIEAFKQQLGNYKTEKSAIQFPLDKPIPVKLVTEIVKYRMKDNLDKEQAKQLMKKAKKRG